MYVFGDEDEVLTRFVKVWGKGKFDEWPVDQVINGLVINYGLVVVIKKTKVDTTENLPVRVISAVQKPNLNSTQIARLTDVFEVDYDDEVEWIQRIGGDPVTRKASQTLFGEHEYRSLKRNAAPMSAKLSKLKTIKSPAWSAFSPEEEETYKVKTGVGYSGDGPASPLPPAPTTSASMTSKPRSTPLWAVKGRPGNVDPKAKITGVFR